jgi:hypothetical protein
MGQPDTKLSKGKIFINMGSLVFGTCRDRFINRRNNVLIILKDYSELRGNVKSG